MATSLSVLSMAASLSVLSEDWEYFLFRLLMDSLRNTELGNRETELHTTCLDVTGFQ